MAKLYLSGIERIRLSTRIIRGSGKNNCSGYDRYLIGNRHEYRIIFSRTAYEQKGYRPV